jgi:hypothetical protein
MLCLQIKQIDNNGTSKKLKFSRSPFNTPGHDDTITMLPTLTVGAYRAVQSTMQEKIVSVKYPLPFVAVNSPVRVLGGYTCRIRSHMLLFHVPLLWLLLLQYILTPSVLEVVHIWCRFKTNCFLIFLCR